MEDLDRAEDASDEDTKYLDDVADRSELRDRYYGLLQELLDAEIGDVPLEHGVTNERDQEAGLLAVRPQRLLDLVRLRRGHLGEPVWI